MRGDQPPAGERQAGGGVCGEVECRKIFLINALMNRKSYARISATPGKTQTINFYNINDELYLVDLPGYAMPEYPH